MPGEGKDTDGDARALLEEAHAGNHYHLGGGKPPPPQMRKLLHVRTVSGPQWPPQEHRDVQEWGGQEATVTGGGGGQGEY